MGLSMALAILQMCELGTQRELDLFELRRLSKQLQLKFIIGLLNSLHEIDHCRNSYRQAIARKLLNDEDSEIERI